MLEYIEGPLAQDAPPMDAAQLARVGQLVRELHDALATFKPSPLDRWQVATLRTQRAHLGRCACLFRTHWTSAQNLVRS